MHDHQIVQRTRVELPRSKLRAPSLRCEYVLLTESRLLCSPIEFEARPVHPSNIVSSGFFVSYRICYFDGIAVFVSASHVPCHCAAFPLIYPRHTMMMRADRTHTRTHVGTNSPNPESRIAFFTIRVGRSQSAKFRLPSSRDAFVTASAADVYPSAVVSPITTRGIDRWAHPYSSGYPDIQGVSMGLGVLAMARRDSVCGARGSSSLSSMFGVRSFVLTAADLYPRESPGAHTYVYIEPEWHHDMHNASA